MNTLLVVFAVTAFLGNSRSANVNKHIKMLAQIDNRNEANVAPKQTTLRRFVRLIQRPKTIYAATCGSPLELTCKAVGAPAPTIHWFRNNAPFYEYDMDSNELIDTESSSVAEVRSTLLVTKPSPEDRYTCFVTAGAKTISATSMVYGADCNSDLSERAKLFPQEPRIVVMYTVFMDVIGNNVVLPCRVKGHPRPRVTWRDYNGSVVNDERMMVLRSGELVIRGLRWSDMGEYTCEAKNVRGAASGTTFLYPTKAG